MSIYDEIKSGFIEDARIASMQQENDLITMTLERLSKLGVFVIVKKCAQCNKQLDIVDGRGVWGISTGLCPKCHKTTIDYLRSVTCAVLEQ